ncbi:MAG: hypothetical protein AB7O49_09420 [Sphingomonadales bacterium]
MNRDRDRERREAERALERRHRNEPRSPNFDDGYGQRWQSAGGHRASPRDWHRDRDQQDDYGEQPYGVGAEAAYGVPADGYFERRYRSNLPEGPRQKFPEEPRRPYMQQDRHDPETDGDWERQARGHFPRPGYHAPVSGQVTQGGFWAADFDGPDRGPLTGDELRGRGHFLDHDYVSWREDQLRAHDRDYHDWREERRRSYDDEYANWRRERQDKFGKDFTDWRSQRGAPASGADQSSPAASSPEAQRRNPLTASRESDKKKQDV